MDFTYDKKTEKLIIANSTRIEYHQLKLWLTRYRDGYRFTPAFKAGVWDGKDSEFKNGKINMGLWRECMKSCREVNVPFNILNKEDFPLNRDVTLESVTEFCKEFFKDHKIKNKEGEWISFFPYDHQIDTAFKILKSRYALAEVATSGGKSLIIGIVYFYTLRKLQTDAKMLIIVPSISLVTQMYDGIIENYYGKNNPHMMIDYNLEFELADGSIVVKNPKEEIITKKGSILAENIKVSKEIKKIRKIKLDREIRIEEVMSDKPRTFSTVDNPNIYIGTYQSLVNYPKEFMQQFHTVVCDEAHTAKAASLKSILAHTFGHAYNRFGVSGTFPIETSMEILTIQAVLGPKVSDIKAKQLIDKGIITQMDIKVVFLNHNDKEFNDRIAYIRKSGGGKEAYLIEKQYVHLSDKRMEFIKKIILKCTNNSLVLFNTIEYGTRLYEKLKEEIPDKDFYYIDGEVNNTKRSEIIAELNKENDPRTKILVASFKTLGTGISINNLYNVLFVDSYKKEQIIVQSIGRILRLHEGKHVANVFDIVDIFEKDPNNIFYKHFLEREQFYIKREYPYKITKINL